MLGNTTKPYNIRWSRFATNHHWGGGGGGRDYLPTTEKRTVIKIITKTKLSGQ